MNAEVIPCLLALLADGRRVWIAARDYRVSPPLGSFVVTYAATWPLDPDPFPLPDNIDVDAASLEMAKQHDDMLDAEMQRIYNAER